MVLWESLVLTASTKQFQSSKQIKTKEKRRETAAQLPSFRPNTNAPKSNPSKSMESDSWSRLSSTASRRLQSRYDLYLGFEEMDGGGEEDAARVGGMEYNCPFCGEDFDFVGFCCHVDDEHVVETKNGVCPICAARVGIDLVGHLTMQHASYFKLQRKRRYRKTSSGSSSLLSLLRKDLRDGTLQSLLAGSSLVQPSATAAAADPFLSSFISNFPSADSTKAEKTDSSTTRSGLLNKTTEEKLPERAESTSLSEKDQREMTRRSEFVQGIVLSTLFDDMLWGEMSTLSLTKKTRSTSTGRLREK